MKKCNLSPEKERKKSEKGTWRNYFLRILGKYNFRDEKQFVRFAKWLIFIVLVVVEIFTVLQHINNKLILSRGFIFQFLSTISSNHPSGISPSKNGNRTMD